MGNAMLLHSPPSHSYSSDPCEARRERKELDAMLLWMKLYNFEKNNSLMPPGEQLLIQRSIIEIRRELQEVGCDCGNESGRSSTTSNGDSSDRETDHAENGQDDV